MKFFLITIFLLSSNIFADAIAQASSKEIDIPDFNPSNAFDGDLRTRWSSNRKFPQYLSLKLPRSINIKDIEIFWEGAYAKKYNINVSENGIDWKLIHTTLDKNSKDKDKISFNQFQTAKYVRFDFLEKATYYGASIFEVKFNQKFLSELVPSNLINEIRPDLIPLKPNLSNDGSSHDDNKPTKLKRLDNFIYI
ncbi:MAG: discoidin domain-containing protein [Lentisphaerales bacterium]|nr:discoidin domain-containing protein [Lentisphaerales bacterium]